MTEDIVNKMNRELGELSSKIEANHEVHLENREDIKKILEQTIKTNGRVTKLEDFVAGQYKLNSKWDGQFMANWKRLEEQDQRHAYSMGMLKVIGVVAGFIIIGGSYVFTLIVKDIFHKDLIETLAQYDIVVDK